MKNIIRNNTWFLVCLPGDSSQGSWGKVGSLRGLFFASTSHCIPGHAITCPSLQPGFYISCPAAGGSIRGGAHRTTACTDWMSSIPVLWPSKVGGTAGGVWEHVPAQQLCIKKTTQHHSTTGMRPRCWCKSLSAMFIFEKILSKKWWWH